MLASIIWASEPATISSGLIHSYSLWCMNRPIVFQSSMPFSRYDIVRIYPSLKKEYTYEIEPVSVKELDSREIESLGVFAPVITKIPLSIEVDYEFETVSGDIEIVQTIRTEINDQCLYVLLLFAKTPSGYMIGTDKTYGDKIEVLLDLREEFEQIVKKIKNA